MDEIARYNQARWTALAAADALYTRPRLDLDAVSAEEIVNAGGRPGSVAGKDVLCLAGGGGRQSAAFALLGANVTVFDLSAEQLERDRHAAEHYAAAIETVQGDMRDLSALENESFDIVDHGYSLSFVPDAAEVFRQVAAVIRPGGIYRFGVANPFTIGMQPGDWNGGGYVLKNPYVAGAQIIYDDQEWVYEPENRGKVPRPVEYRHTLSQIFDGLTENGFIVSRVSDQTDMYPDAGAEPATWDHFVAFAPPWLTVLALYRPGIKIE
mgnify:CR=1 FL=1